MCNNIEYGTKLRWSLASKELKIVETKLKQLKKLEPKPKDSIGLQIFGSVFNKASIEQSAKLRCSLRWSQTTTLNHKKT
ncbi:hypothetical protein K0M31_012905 [Melipona bicolor]|uniref:Uncharacterized protein n=1 Tax=Melipona bicolor TaxID=60889 RepID=A0AA40FJ44_9HYME|nr:hypothetical protein K0M31_012905 [Melipona bicolor]